MPSTEIVTIVVGGVPYTGWKSMSVKMGAKSPERSFQITGALGADGVAAAILSIEAGAPCVLMSNGDVLCVGRVHEVEIELGPESHGIRLSGKSRGADAIKSSVDHDKHEFEQKDPLTIAQEIDKSGIGYKATVPLDKIPKARANVGDTQAKFLTKLLQKQNVWLCADKDGGIKMTQHCEETHAGGIVEGMNFMQGTAKFSVEDRMQNYKVKHHQPKGSKEKNFRGETIVTDPQGRPGTSKVIVPKTPLTKGEAQKLGKHVKGNRQGDSVSLNCTLQGFRDEAGRIWEPGNLVFCAVPSCLLAEELALNDVELYQDESGTGSVARLVLVHPSAFGKEAGKAGQKVKSQSIKGGWKSK